MFSDRGHSCKFTSLKPCIFRLIPLGARHGQRIAISLGWVLCVAVMLLARTASAASIGETQSFLRDHRHAWLPYPFPFETSTNELGRLLAYDFDAVGLLFAGSYHGGSIDFSQLDAGINLVAAKNRKVVLHLTPRFDESDGVFDYLSDGSIIPNQWNKSPNAAMIDIFDARQRNKFYQFLEICARRYGHDPRVLGFVIGWGYMGETGFYIGNYLADFKQIGSVASGYSPGALKEFNLWRRRRRFPELKQLPRPSNAGPARDYILFHQFRTEFAGEVFQKEAIARMKSFTRKPTGTFGYISVNVANYGRDWTATPNADFYRSAAAAASFDLHRTLVDSGVGWEDNEFHDGSWNFTLACMERDIARQIARGAVHHAMPIREYETSPKWETNLFPRLATFLLSQRLDRKVRTTPATVALFQPTWAAAALPVRGEGNLFVPREGVQRHLSKMTGLVESFGLPYELITEQDLLVPGRLRRFRHIVVPMWDLMPDVLGEKVFTRLAHDPRLIPIPIGNQPIPRSKFRELLQAHGITPRLDFEGESIIGGRVQNLLLNWSDRPLSVKILENKQSLVLQPMEYRFLSSAEAK
jgi:hypothetical protein